MQIPQAGRHFYKPRGGRLEMKLKSRIERLERREGLPATGPISISVFDSVINETISDADWARWQPFFECIFGSVDDAEVHEERADSSR